MRRRPPFIAVWTAALTVATAAVVLVVAKPWQPLPPPIDPVRAAAAETAWSAAHPAPVQIATIGDSYTGGSNMGGNGPANWTSVVAQQLTGPAPVEIHKAATSGIGYVSQGTVGVTFLDEVPDAVSPDTRLVVVFGSRNDLGKPGDVGAAAAKVYAAVRAIAPKATLLVVGPPWINEDVPAGLAADRDAVKAAAAAAGATFVDPIADGWFAGAASNLIGADHVHPTDAGHAYMARFLLPRIQQALAAS
ncbi:MAG: SGNH/GDSL hydrolase family protein [Myxococcaceae bacterium]|nr:MAG: SGNH/GDSL hydrolase family protein [Myxococcaceae bacterium]